MIKTLTAILSGLAAILASLVVLLAVKEFPEKALGGSSGTFGLSVSVNNPANNDGFISTTTLNYLTPGTGTTTVTINTTGTDQADLNIFMVASSTSSGADLRWTVEFSHSTSSIASEQLWFPLAEEVNINATTTFRTQIAKEYGWKPATTTRHNIATSTNANNIFTSPVASTRISIKDIAARWTRISFYIPTGSLTDSRMDTLAESTALDALPSATSTNAGIFVQIVSKEPY
mgnify:CR=1 FL=1